LGWLVLRRRLLSFTLGKWLTVFRGWLLLLLMIKWGRRFVFRRRSGLVGWRIVVVFGRLVVISQY
jgi:hypothetical protein